MKFYTTIILLISTLSGTAQAVLWKGEEVDSILIQSHVSAYQFDERGTLKGEKETLVIAYSITDDSYTIINHYINHYTGSIRGENKNQRSKRDKKVKGTNEGEIPKTVISGLLSALQIQEDPRLTYAYIDDDFLEAHATEKFIRKIAKSYYEDRHFPWKNSAQESRQAFINRCQSIDSFQVYLAQRFTLTKNFVTVDYSDQIVIRIKTNQSEYYFEGKYPNPVKQPWYQSPISTTQSQKPILNLNINRFLEIILPNEFVNRSSITFEALLTDYIIWSLERRE